MVSNIDTGRRALVCDTSESLAVIHGLELALTRESTDRQLRAAYRTVSRKSHPDKGGTPEHQKALNAGREAWEDSLRASTGRGNRRDP